MYLGKYLLGPNDTPENGIYTGDAKILSEAIPDESVDLVFTDPPYHKEYLSLYGWLGEIANRVLKPNGSCLVYAGHPYFRTTLSLLENSLEFFTTLCVWEPGMNSRIFSKRIMSGWRPVLMMRRKDAPNDTPWIPNALSSTFRDKRYHRWGQNVLPAKIWIRYLCPEGGVILDPFAGGGTSCAAAKQVRRAYLAFEIDPEVAERARERVRNTQPPLFVLGPEQIAMEFPS